MKRSEITRELGFIDPEFIAEAARYKPHKISKIKVVALAACIAVLVTAIPLALILNRENGNTEDLPAITTKNNTVIDNPEPNKEDPLIIFCSSPTELKKQLKADANVEIKDVAERKDFSLAVNDTVVEKKAGTPYVKTVTIGNETFEVGYEESRASETYQSLDEHLKKYASIDIYSTPYNDGIRDGKITAIFSQETGQLVEYFKGSSFAKSGDLDEDKLRKIAEQEIYTLYGINIAENPDYRYEVLVQNLTLGSRQVDYYQISFRRYIGGLETDEKICVSLDTSGQIIKVRQNFGLYDEVAKLLNNKKINSAIESFTKQLNNTPTIEEKTHLSLDNYGNCAISFSTFIWIESIAGYTYYKTCVEITK